MEFKLLNYHQGNNLIIETRNSEFPFIIKINGILSKH